MILCTWGTLFYLYVTYRSVWFPFFYTKCPTYAALTWHLPSYKCKYICFWENSQLFWRLPLYRKQSARIDGSDLAGRGLNTISYSHLFLYSIPRGQSNDGNNSGGSNGKKIIIIIVETLLNDFFLLTYTIVNLSSL